MASSLSYSFSSLYFLINFFLSLHYFSQSFPLLLPHTHKCLLLFTDFILFFISLYILPVFNSSNPFSPSFYFLLYHQPPPLIFFYYYVTCFLLFTFSDTSFLFFHLFRKFFSHSLFFFFFSMIFPSFSLFRIKKKTSNAQ